MTRAKQRCVKCGGMLDTFRMELMMGPKGFRRYAVHVEKCVKSPTPIPPPVCVLRTGRPFPHRKASMEKGSQFRGRQVRGGK